MLLHPGYARTIYRSRYSNGLGPEQAHLRATIFYENVHALLRASLATQGPIRLPWGNDNTSVPLVSVEDVARVAAGLLTSPTVPSGSAYLLVGAVLMLREILAAFSLSSIETCVTKRSQMTNGEVMRWLGESTRMLLNTFPTFDVPSA